jgi:hypothetical protein
MARGEKINTPVAGELVETGGGAGGWVVETGGGSVVDTGGGCSVFTGLVLVGFGVSLGAFLVGIRGGTLGT